MSANGLDATAYLSLGVLTVGAVWWLMRKTCLLSRPDVDPSSPAQFRTQPSAAAPVCSSSSPTLRDEVYRLADNGATVMVIAERLGMARGEVQLLLMARRYPLPPP